MKKCPFCKADIEDHARFCLYCMTSLEEKQTIEYSKCKNKRWLFIIAAVLVFAVIIFSIWAFNRKSGTNISNNGFFETTSTSKTESTATENNDTAILNSSPQSTDSDTENKFTGSDSSKNNGSDKIENYPSSNTGSVQGSQSNAENDEESASSGSPSGTGSNNNGTLGTLGDNNSPSNIVSDNSNSQNSDKTNSGGSSSTANVTSNTNSGQSATQGSNNSTDNKTPNSTTDNSISNNTSTVTTAVYSYRDAKYGDDFSVSADFENCVVITGVSTASSNGEYVIPETLNGKRVIAIMGLAFCDESIKDSVKKVIVPSTVKTIWNYAFADCRNLSDIYFCGNSIYTEAQAFAESSSRTVTLTIHCSATCNDRNFRYYKNSASSYGALYEEWNG